MSQMDKNCTANGLQQLYHCANQEEQSFVLQCLLDCLSTKWTDARCWNLGELSQNTA